MNRDDYEQALVQHLGPDGLTWAALSKKLAVSTNTARRMVKRGELPRPTQLGVRRLRFLPLNVAAHLAAQVPSPVRPTGPRQRGRPRKILPFAVKSNDTKE